MKVYLVKIVMRDGSCGLHHGIYVDGFAAVIYALELFPDAKRISAQPEVA